MADEVRTPNMMGALAQLAYGTPEANPMGALQQLATQALETPEDRRANEWLAFAGGIATPDTSGRNGVGGGIAAQSKERLARDQLKMQYLPLISQALMQQQQMTLAAATSSRDYLKDINPRIDTQLAAMRTGDARPEYGEVVQRLLQMGQDYQVPAQILAAKLQGLPRDTDELAAHLDRMAVAGAGADKMLPSVTNDATGRQTATSAVRGTAVPLGARRGDNPTSADSKFSEASRGDVKSYEDGLRARVDSYESMMARMNEQAEYVKSFQPGRYAKMAGGFAAAVKDIGARIPGVDKKTVEDIANKLIGAPPESPQALAAQQLFEQLAQQETLAQLKTSLGEGQRMNQAEYANFAKTNLGQAMDPEAFVGLRKFFATQAANAVNKYKGWSEYVGSPETKVPSVTGFDAAHSKKTMDFLLDGNRGVKDSANPASSKPTYKDPVPASGGVAVPPAAAAPIALKDFNAKLYEPGAKLGPTGKVYVIENGVPRAASMVGPTPAAAQPLQPARVLPRGAPSLDALTITPDGGPRK
jgi:hypothetical protein